MTKLDELKQKVESLYRAKNPERADWADWMYDNHVLVVAGYAKSLAEKYEADAELAQAAALLHDIADSKIKRGVPDHADESLAMARQLMKDCGYSREDIELVVEDAIRFHSCHGDERPQSKEGLILATADSLAHFKTDFYLYAAHAFGRDRKLEDLKKWALEKFERDLNVRIAWDDEREDARPDYEMLKNLFSR
jgi:putative nucleotidyltransferase with HDIG domain